MLAAVIRGCRPGARCAGTPHHQLGRKRSKWRQVVEPNSIVSWHSAHQSGAALRVHIRADQGRAYGKRCWAADRCGLWNIRISS